MLLVTQSRLTLCDPMEYSPWNFSDQNTGVGKPFPSPRDLPSPGIEPRSPTSQAYSLPAEPPRKPKNIGVVSLSLLQWIFPTQGSNRGLLHCRWILYQLSHKGSPRILEWVAYPSSSGSSQPSNWTRLSCIAGRFFTNWAITWVRMLIVKNSTNLICWR